MKIIAKNHPVRDALSVEKTVFRIWHAVRYAPVDIGGR